MVSMWNKNIFDTITIDVGPMQNVILKSAISEGINLRKIGKSRIGISLDERTRPAIIEAVWRSFGIKRKDKDLTQVIEFRTNYTDLLISLHILYFI